MMTDNDEIQSIQIGDYATVVSPVDNVISENQVNIFYANIRVIRVILLCMFLLWQEGRFLHLQFLNYPCKSVGIWVLALHKINKRIFFLFRGVSTM